MPAQNGLGLDEDDRTRGRDAGARDEVGHVEPARFLDVLLATVLSAPEFRPYGEHVKTRRFEPRFKLPLALKDMELALATAHDRAVQMPLVSPIRDHMLEGIATGHGELDWAALTSSRRTRPVWRSAPHRPTWHGEPGE